MRFHKRPYSSILLCLAGGAAVVVLLKASGDMAHAQDTLSAGASSSEREAAWNDPAMLRARAWLNDYCKSSDLVSEAQAAAHLQTLETMSPDEMKLFAMTHDAVTSSHPVAQVHQVQQQALEHAKQAAAAQQWWYKNVHKAEMQQAMQADAGTQQAYANIEQGESGAANQAESQLRSEQAFAEQNQTAKLDELNNPFPTTGYADPYVSGYPDTHFHFHLYPTP